MNTTETYRAYNMKIIVLLCLREPMSTLEYCMLHVGLLYMMHIECLYSESGLLGVVGIGVPCKKCMGEIISSVGLSSVHLNPFEDLFFFQK